MKRPSFQFYPADYRNNGKLRRCSWAARGAWTETLGLLHDSDEYGVLRWPLKEIAQAVGCPLNLLKELAAKDVLKGGDKGAEPYVHTPRHANQDGDPVTLVVPGDGPCWYSSRLVRDEWVRQRRGKGTRYEADDASPNPSPNESPNPSPKGGIGEPPLDEVTGRNSENFEENLPVGAAQENSAEIGGNPHESLKPDSPKGGIGEGSGDGPTSTSTSTVNKTLNTLSGEPDDMLPGFAGKTPPAKKQKQKPNPPEIGEVLSYLNQKSGFRYGQTKSNVGFVSARLEDGATVQQCKAVIDAKVKEWGNDPAWRKYLRPQTLFNETKFSSYVAQIDGGGSTASANPDEWRNDPRFRGAK